MKRPMLVCGVALAFTCAVLVSTGTVAAAFLLTLSASVLILYFIKPLKLRDKIIIPTICLSLIFGSISFLIYHSTKVEPFLKYHGLNTSVSGKIIDVPNIKDGYGTFTIKIDNIENESVSAKASVRLPSDTAENLEPLDYISISGAKISVPYNDKNEYEATYISNNTILEINADNARTLWKGEKTPYYYCLKLKILVSQQIDAFLNTEESGFLKGMLFGDKNDISDSTLSDFRASGIAHLLAVSGLHTSLWCGILISVFSFFRIKEKLRNIICLLFLIFFCIISAFTPSVLRASVMMAIILIAPFFKRQHDSLNSLGLALTLLILTNPYIVSSVSFQLSAVSTFGVLSAKDFNYKIVKKTVGIKNPILKKSANYILTNLSISTFAGLFTLPVSACYFGVFSLAAPLTNILSMQLSFWGMVFGVISTVLSFIPLTSLKTFSIFLFKITAFLLNTVTDISAFIADFKYCSLPIQTKNLFSGLIITVIIVLISFLVIKKKATRRHLKAVAIVCVLINLLCILMPATSAFGSEITVHNVGNGVNVSLRSGVHYGFFNLTTEENRLNTDKLPRATAESLDFVYIASFGSKADNLSEKLFSYNPEAVFVTEYVKEYYREKNRELPNNTLIADSHKFSLNNKINIETVDTYNTDYVIIKKADKKVFICYGENTDLSLLFEKHGVPDILILPDTIPDGLPRDIHTLIISCDSDIILNKNTHTLKNQCEKFYTTAENGSITLTL